MQNRLELQTLQNQEMAVAQLTDSIFANPEQVIFTIGLLSLVAVGVLALNSRQGRSD